MKIRLLLAGKTAVHISEGMAIYEKRLKFYTSIETRIIPEIRLSKSMDTARLKSAESAAFMKQVKDSDYLILLDEQGRMFTSSGFAKLIENHLTGAKNEVVFAIGGAHGFDESIKRRANLILSLSSLTFPHQLARLIFTEQLYRAFTIIRNEPYHHT